MLPRVLSIQEIAKLNRAIRVETEAFVFGGLCVMTEGRCYLSSYATGKSPNLNGVCSPPEMVSYDEDARGTTARLSGFTIDRYAPGAPAGYPTLCKGKFKAGDAPSYLFEDPVSLNAGSMIAGLKATGVTALKIEGRQRGKGYVTEVVRAFEKPSMRWSRAVTQWRSTRSWPVSRKAAGRRRALTRSRGDDVHRTALTLLHVLHWPADRLADFYRRIADEAPVDRVHIGEVVCGKRMPSPIRPGPTSSSGWSVEARRL